MLVQLEPLKPPIHAGGGSRVTPLLVPQPLGKTLSSPHNFPQTERLITPQPPLEKSRVNYLHTERNSP